MRGKSVFTNPKILSIVIAILFVFTTISTAQANNITKEYNREVFDDFDWENGIPDISSVDVENLDPNSAYPEDVDVGQFLSDNDNTYNQVWDPWVSKAAIHAVATTEDGDMLALAGGYLYDNQVHLYRWNNLENRYDLVWEIGGGIFQSDVTSLAFADSDYNNLTEIVAGGEDGVLYVFEQRHIYDPFTNMENQFDLVWKSPRLGRIFDVMVYDSDGDYRQDIIVGTGDTVRWYEYDTHGNYPFSEEHWIEFREVFSLQLPSQVTALGISDVNSNGLKEVATGTRSGAVHLLENNGTTLLINGHPYPIIQDNSYRNIWNSGNIVRRPISDMAGGDLDGDGEMELMIAVQGQGAYVLDTIDGTYGLFRIQREFQSWEANPIEMYPLDVYTDAMTNSSSMLNETMYLPVIEHNVYYDNGTRYPEPLDYDTYGNFIIYPYSSYSVMNQKPQPDSRYTVFDNNIANSENDRAWAEYDWGNDEEATGNGIPSIPEMIIHVEAKSVAADQLNISISADNINFYTVNSTYVKASASGNFYNVEMDPTMADADINFYRYFRFEVLSGVLKVDVFETKAWNNPIYDALSVETGFMTFKNEETASPVGYVGTIDGAILAVTWDADEQKYVIRWDSWNDERWKLKTNIFDLETVKHTGRFPGWIDRGTSSDTLDLSGTLPDGGKVASWTAENFYNSRNENFLEYVVVSTLGTLYVYQQTSPYTAPIYNPQLTQMLFGDLGTRTFGPSSGYGMQTWATFMNGNDNTYLSVSILPIDVTVVSSSGDAFNPYENGFMLYLGGWDGSLGNLDQGDSKFVARGQVDVSLWYLVTNTNVPDPNQCDAYSLPVCSYFNPIRQTNNFNTFYPDPTVASLSTQELTGQMWGTFAASTWMPKVAAADFIAGEHNDYVVTNGKLTLMEAQFGFGYNQAPDDDFQFSTELKQFQQVAIQTDPILSEYNFVVKGGYFDEINDNSKGRHWSNANPVDFDGDGDMDLILGFATYSSQFFGMDKVTFGATYWENEGTREEPIWVEKPLAITNTDPDSGFRAQNYTDPLFIYDEYDMTKVRDSPLGYHPSFRTERPQRLLMWQPIDHSNIFTGSIHTFFAEYNHPTSLLAATYPEAKRIDINLQYVDNGGYDTDINYGFHVFETWDNSEELNDWTLSLSTADLDEDGKNEIIVGDFNNNIYVFEHLSNNTYKRAFKSFDINRTIQTDISPYAHEQFDGIGGEFSRTLFDHIEFLIAGFDLNNNDRQEFIAATENMIFVFEATTSPTGRIIDDTYQLIKIIDLLDFPTLSEQDPDQTKITAMTWADDLTQDGRRELIIAATSALLVLEIDKAPTPGYQQAGQFNMEEIFFADSYNLLGLYDLPGNYFIHPELVIETLLVEDLDTDGYIDLALGGTNTFGARPLYDGFLTILEWRGSGFRLMEEEGMFDEMLKYNPVHDLAVDDTDFDGHKELLVGHDYGIDIYEFTKDNTIVLMEVITSSPHYQFPDRYYGLPSINPLHVHKDVIRSPDGQSLIMVYSDQSGLWYTTSFTEGETWTAPIQLSTAGAGPIIGQQPSLAIGDGLTVWLSYVVRTAGVSTVQYDIYVIKDLVPGNNIPKFVARDYVYRGSLDESTPSPRLFNIAGITDLDVMGLVYIGHQNQTGHYLNNAMRFVKLDWGEATIIRDEYFPDWSNTTILPNQFSVHSLDIVQLDGYINEYTARRYGVVFAGYPWGESKSMDLDLFYDEIYLNNTADWLFNVTNPNRIYASGMAAQNPSIIQEQHTGNLLVTYEEATLRPYGGLWAVWSNDRGYSWNGPHDMSHPLGVDMPLLVEALPTKSRESYVITTTIGFEAISDFESRVPVVVPGSSRGFTMVYNVRLEFQVDIPGSEKQSSRVGLCSQPDDGGYMSAHKTNYNSDGCKQGIDLNMFASAINPWSNFTWYELGAVSALVVGDTDRDSRHEILVASGKQAFLYEFAHNSATYILHEQKWVSDPYERDLTGIAISDANGNGLPEIVLESDRGIVHTYEVTDTLMGTSDLIYSRNEFLINSPETPSMNSVSEIISADLTGDGIDDIVYATLGGYLIAINGATLAQIWVKTYADISSPLYYHTAQPVIRITLGLDEIDNSGEFVALSRLSTVTVFNSLTGTQEAFKDFGGSSPEKEISFMSSADVVSDGIDEILIGLYNGSVYLLDSSDLAVLWSYDFSLGMGTVSENDIIDIVTSSFSIENQTEIAIVNNQGDLAVLDGADGGLVWQTHVPVLSQTAGIAVFDSNNDGYTDIIIGNNATFALNGLDGTQLWNSTERASSGSNKVMILYSSELASVTAVQTSLAGTGLIVDIFDYSSATPMLTDLREYSIIITMGAVTQDDPDAVGNVLADYVDLGGKLIMFAYSFVGTWSIGGKLQFYDYMPLTAYKNDNLGRTYDGLSQHLIFDVVSSLSGSTNSMNVEVTSGASVIASYDDSMPLAAIKGNVIAFNTYYSGTSGEKETLILNTVAYLHLMDTVVTQEPLIYDVNNDEVQDIIYTKYHHPGEPALISLSGVNGEVLWEYTPSISGFDRFNGIVKMVNLDANRDILIFQNSNINTNEPGLTILIDPNSGIAMGGINNPNSGVALEISNLGSNKPYVLVGDSMGNITIHSLWGGQPRVTADPIPKITSEPFFRLGSEFTRRTEYLMYDFIQAPDQPVIGDGDGVDDVIVIDDFYIGAGDTYRLLEDPAFNKVEWDIQTSDIDMGRYIGGAKLGDINADGNMDLVAPFTNYLLAIDIEKGVVLWEYKHWIYDDYGRIRDFEFQLVNLDGGPELEIVYSRFFWYMGCPVSELTTLDSKGNVLKTRYIPFGKDLVFNTGDIDDDNKLDIVASVNYAFNPLISIITVLDQDLNNKTNPVVLTGMFPITEIAMGDFDKGISGDEFIFFFEMAKLNLPEIIYNLIGFPTMFVHFAWNGGTYAMPSGLDNIVGLAPTGEPTENYWVREQIDGVTYLIVESRTGDLFNYDFSATNPIMSHTGIIRDKAIPYAKTSFATGQFADCGVNSFVTLTAANSLSCYYASDNSLNFNKAEEGWSLTLEFSVIQDIVVADLDDDTIDDLMIASFSGHVWVTRSNPPKSLLLDLSSQQNLLDHNANDQQSGPTIKTTDIVSVGLLVSPFVALFIWLKKKRKINI
ncbi:MAG: outer membrane protein assembly factor BamB family protein [Candidatus Kariarchaeaceae archaeon]|jgi:hypothetical protein